MTIRDDLTYNSNTTSQNDTKINYVSNQLSFSGALYIKKVWSVNATYEFNSREKTFQYDNNLNTHLLNLFVKKTFKNDEFTAYVVVRDILNQNIGITRNFSGNSYVEVRNDRIKRYFLIGFSWDFKNKAAKK